MTHRTWRPPPGGPPVWLAAFADPASAASGRRILGGLVADAARGGEGGIVVVDLSGLQRLSDAWLTTLAAVRRHAGASGIFVRTRHPSHTCRSVEQADAVPTHEKDHHP